MPTEKIPPHNNAAEESVIGSILIDGECIHDLRYIVEAVDFYQTHCQCIYIACLELAKRGEAINQVTVAYELKDKLGDIGGASYLSKVISETPTSIGVEDYARIVKNTSILRKVISAGYKIHELGFLETDPTKAIANAEKLVLQLQNMVSMPKLITPKELATRGVERYTDLRDGKRKGIYTGYKELDKALGGLFGGELCYIASRPGLGKTTILLKIAEYAGIHHGSVFMASLEQPWADILDRMVGSELELSPRIVRAGNYKEELFDQIFNYMGVVDKSNIYFYDTGGDIDGRGTTTASIYSIATHMKMAYGLSAIFIDYLGLIDDEKRDSNYERVTYISRKLKRLAIDLDVPVICACQLNREVEKRVSHIPQLSDMRDSGAIEQDADTVLFLYRSDYYEDEKERAEKEGKSIEGEAEIIIGKQRQAGEVAGVTIPIRWNKLRRFYEDKYMTQVIPEQFR